MINRNLIPRTLIDKIRTNPKGNGIVLEYISLKDFNNYTGREISEMYLGIYRQKKILKVDEGYFIEMKNVKRVVCDCIDIASSQKHIEIKTNEVDNSQIKDIKDFWIKDYYLITKTKYNGQTKHKITDLLCKLSGLKRGIHNGTSSLKINNQYDSLINLKPKPIPKSLFEPIRIYINRLFFKEDYYLKNFRLYMINDTRE